MNEVKKRQSSLSRKVVTYLRANPGEMLTRSDIGIKFNVAPVAVDTQLAAAVARGELVCGRNDDDGLVWSLGGPTTSSPHPFAHGERIAKAARRERLHTSRSLDLDAIQIDKGVAFVDRPKRAEQWTRLIAAMSEVGDSFAVPAWARNALYKAASDYKQVVPSFAFAIRVVNDDQCRIWRRA